MDKIHFRSPGFVSGSSDWSTELISAIERHPGAETGVVRMAFSVIEALDETMFAYVPDSASFGSSW
jgi:hypothetical protein